MLNTIIQLGCVSCESRCSCNDKRITYAKVGIGIACKRTNAFPLDAVGIFPRPFQVGAEGGTVIGCERLAGA